jgi:KDO2-lipid IV(A) lauroyltransferase
MSDPVHATGIDASPQPPPAIPANWRLKLYYAVFGLLFWLVMAVGRFRHATARDNLAKSFPDRTDAERRAIEREYIRRQAEVFAELAYASRIGEDELRRRVVVTQPELLAAAAAPRPLVLSGAHQCNWEWMLLRLSLDLGPGLLGLYKPLSNARADAWLKRLRERFGARMVPAKSVLAELARFREARAIGLVADQTPRTTPEKHWLEFLNQDTAFYMGPELLARALRSQCVLVTMRRLARGVYALDLEPLNEPGQKLETGTITERYARGLEAAIRRDPAGWWWSHRRWKLKRKVY